MIEQSVGVTHSRLKDDFCCTVLLVIFVDGESGADNNKMLAKAL